MVSVGATRSRVTRLAGMCAGVVATSPRTALVWRLLRAALEGRPEPTAAAVLDVGGGTGGFAVPLAELGHAVTVVDPSPDSLAALQRRAAEAGVSARVHGLQGDAAGVLDVAEPAAFDVVVCHSVLEVLDDPAAALAVLVRTLRPGGLVSLLVANRAAAVLGRALAGRLAEAVGLLDDAVAGDGPPRRFDVAELLALARSAGLRPGPVHGIRVLSDLLPGSLLDDPASAAALLDLEQRLADRPPYRDIATQLHLLADRVG